MFEFRRFWTDRSANMALLSGVLAIPLMVATGLGIDYARYSSAHRHLQELADASSLALAASEDLSEEKMRALAEDMLVANSDASRIRNVTIASLDIEDDQVDIALDGDIQATFMGLAGYETLKTRASALAVRAVMGNVEVALILDNTWSMSETGANGTSKIGTLKTAADTLVSELLETEDGAVRIGLVPYADYVNVGVENRGASWLDVPADYSVEPEPRECQTVKRDVCVEREPSYACTTTIDGVVEQRTCSGACTKRENREVEQCSGGGDTKHFTWHGCVGSRMTGNSRLHDQTPSIRYPGYVERWQRCLNPIVPLSSDRSALKTAIDDMIINIGGYKPYTYIPAGLIWGLNLLAPGEPFAGAAAYDPVNAEPRKVAVLMTDGENTLRYRASDGRHREPNGNASENESELAKTNSDTVAICDYMKEQNIEIFTVAFMVDDDDAKEMLEDCATDDAHYFDASDNKKLLAAFGAISDSLRVVRLAR